MTSCGTCGQDVDRDEHRDAHNPKTCLQCRQELPGERFPVWPAAGDGRRRTCGTCSSSNCAVQDRKTAESLVPDRETRNARFRTYGFRWVPSTHPDFRGRRWILLDANGVSTAPAEAEARIMQMESDEEEHFDDEGNSY